MRSSKDVFMRSLTELSVSAAETIVELVDQGSLYRGDEFLPAVEDFLKHKKKFDKLAADQQDNYCWLNIDTPAVRIRNTAIGTLLIDLSNNADLDQAVRKFESVVAPANYKRPKPIFTKRMIQEAQKTIQSLGLENSLARKFAEIEEVSVNDVLFVSRDSRDKMKDSIFDELAKEAAQPIQSKTFDKVEEISIEDFISKVLPKVTSIEAMVENKHSGNFMSIIGAQERDTAPLFKWDNNFCWMYNGDVADSIKDNVKKAGGRTDGFMRFSIQWNESGNNNSDYDAHCICPDRGHIFFRRYRKNSRPDRHKSGGQLDVDIINPNGKIAVENITFPNKKDLQAGNYKFYVNPYSVNGKDEGFSAEIEIGGELHEYEYRRPLGRKNVEVATVSYSKTKGFTVDHHLKSTLSSREIWGVNTQQFTKVQCVMLSPNFWHGAKYGNKHYCFILDGCKNENNPRGFLNEYLKEDFTKHRKVFEALGSKMKVGDSDNQLSGVAFSSTKKNSLVVKVDGKFKRMLKINF